MGVTRGYGDGEAEKKKKGKEEREDKNWKSDSSATNES